ncbi:MAG: hypothetical protein LCH37_01705 [Bacteroidetes bacterium]|nr:hypothetical protein [Bacteroidota bacterium]
MNEQPKVNEKHLDHIQAVITRHNSNSFMIKGWAITICTVVLTVAGTWKEPVIALVALVPVFVFWLLDSFYLANERCFVSLYSAAINGYSLKVKNEDFLAKEQELTTLADGKKVLELDKEIEILSKPYSMNFMPFRKIKRNNWQAVIKSRTIIWFYLMLTGFSVALFIGLLILNNPAPNEPLKVSATIQSDSLLIKTEQPNFIINNIILNDSIIKRDTIK